MSRFNLQVHFLHLHLQDVIVILEEVNRPHPQCPYCNMFIPWTAINWQKFATALFMQGVEPNFKILKGQESQEGDVLYFKGCVHPLAMVSCFLWGV